MDDATEAQFQAQRKEFERLYECIKPIVWLVKVTCANPKQPVMTKFLTAFAISKEGELMTCTRGGWDKWSSKKIVVKRLSQTDKFRHEFISVEANFKCGMALLKVSVGPDGIECGDFGSGTLNYGETIMTIGHPNGLVGSCLIGQVAYPCCIPDSGDFIHSDTSRCETYQSESLDYTPAYRLAGHVWNDSYFKQSKHSQVNREVELDLQANVPILQCTGLVGGEGTSGGPMINTQGEIVGMYYSEVCGYNIGIHATALKEFLKQFKVGSGTSGTECWKKNEDEGSSTMSKKMKI